MNVIHRKGDRYREWHSFSDRYCTWPMSRAEMAALLFSREFRVGFAPTAREVARAKDAIEERLERVDAGGTSARDDDGAFRVRCADAWDEEQCPYCEDFHHAYQPTAENAAVCASCGEGKRARSHKRPCAHHAGEQPCRRARWLSVPWPVQPVGAAFQCRASHRRDEAACGAGVLRVACGAAGSACEARRLP